MKKIIAATSAALLGAAVITPTATAAEPASQATIVQAKKSDYPKKKRNGFWRTVKRVDPFVRYAGKKDTVALGVSTCDLLRAGGDVYDLALLVYKADAGLAEDSIIAVIASAPVILCPDQGYKFE